MERLPDEAFRTGRLLRGGVRIVAFLTDWCPFCREVRPEFSALDGKGRFRTGFGDVTAEGSALADEFAIEVIPMVAVFRDGELVFRLDSDPGTGLPPGGMHRVLAEALSASQGAPRALPPRSPPQGRGNPG